MAPLKREEFASAVATTLSSVHHLYREIHRLIGALRDGLAESPDPLVFFGGTAARSGRDQGRLVVRNDYTLLFKPVDESEEIEDEEEEADDSDEDVDSAPRRRRHPALINSTDVLLAVGISVYDPRGAGSFEPHLSYAALSEWSVGNRPSAKSGTFVVNRYMLRRIPKAVMTAGLQPGIRVQTTASVRSGNGRGGSADRRLSAVLPAGVEVVPLFELDDAQALDKVVQNAKEMWRRVAARRVA